MKRRAPFSDWGEEGFEGILKEARQRGIAQALKKNQKDNWNSCGLGERGAA